ncbi:lipase (class 2) [Streptomyces sp. BK208]|uniref:esterase/lipase family protein n=1 Tax=Streptomyces sp. BK208 TaxID=2512150 RepID=UPI00105BAFEE|nr:alpha/beta fold hydrolase [Streptomyces sp. BK208]TDT42582.1 lipase (class 2) [Streptomyces sp. BK208]
MNRSRTHAAGLSLLSAVVIALQPATAALADDRPTSGWNDYSCRPSAEHPRPVILVHGTFGNAVDNWLVLAPYLTRRGYCVFSLDYGQREGIPLFHGLGPVDRSAHQLANFVEHVREATGARQVDLVGHSQGGMMPRYYLRFLGGAPQVHALVGLAPDNHGTTLDGLATLLPSVPASGELLSAAAPAITDQLAGSAFLTRLNAGGDTDAGVLYTVIATRYDEAVTPYPSQFLSGPEVRNVLLQDLCPTDISDHAAIGLSDYIAFHEVANALDPMHATPTTCADAVA